VRGEPEACRSDVRDTVGCNAQRQRAGVEVEKPVHDPDGRCPRSKRGTSTSIDMKCSKHEARNHRAPPVWGNGRNQGKPEQKLLRKSRHSPHDGDIRYISREGHENLQGKGRASRVRRRLAREGRDGGQNDGQNTLLTWVLALSVATRKSPHTLSRSIRAPVTAPAVDTMAATLRAFRFPRSPVWSVSNAAVPLAGDRAGDARYIPAPTAIITEDVERQAERICDLVGSSEAVGGPPSLSPTSCCSRPSSETPLARNFPE
jgi:hypothetical protein